MAQIANTVFKISDLTSHWHRVLGSCCYFLDQDQTELTDGTMESSMREFTYEDNHPKTVAIIDWKYPGKSLSDKYAAIKYQIHSSENEYKTPIPFFIIIYYLDDQYKEKMYYVIPANTYARNFFSINNFPIEGKWLTVYNFSKFQYALRSKKWNEFENIKRENLLAVGLAKDLKLKDLPNSYVEYPLPALNFSWIK